MKSGPGAVGDPHSGLEIPHHLALIMNDIHEPQPGLVLPRRSHVEELLAFDRDRAARYNDAPLVLSCYAGISRSTAAAYILSCQRTPQRDETELALLLRQCAPPATPNPRLIALADELLARRGRMIGAIARIGRGAEAFAGVPFSLPQSGPQSGP